ncbi:NAD-dependent epimerase/dehydratase family protein [Altererythrobacter aurantiacus]|uniref:NAD-dependent epimerase/dehydratase family protein n=1 Tax=Parapontixanthobacter aurantiacus TaxID=1463599 RepID=A0A844ZFL5_9SPHN|nr:complex I NDUFA9 subunit family protein [Parapontixanthobacter aurantiacus]MXO86344.1 NAD-dependent epimerase/dehydratase family protein [Parapontixanthobacter aurantiacus]
MAQSGPLENRLVTIFGGSGFVGNYVAQSLLERGARLRIASRNPEKAFSLRPLANLGQLQFMRCNVLDERSVMQYTEGSHAVVNLVGTFGGNMKKLMGEAPGTMARAAREAGAGAYVQISALAADPEGEAEYARAKALGEERARAEFPGATILRPSILFGRDDDFINMFAQLISTFPVLPVFAPDAPLQLLYVDDAAEAVALALENPATHGGKTYELAGPERLTMMQINRMIADAQLRKRTFLPMPDAVSGAFAMLPGTPMSSDQWAMLKDGDVASGEHPGIDAFGIDPKPLSLYLDKWMIRYRKHGRFADKSSPTI